MKFEMFVWRLYDRCADYLDKHSLVIRVDSDKLQELEDKYWEQKQKLLDKDREIIDLENKLYHLEMMMDRLEEA
jgi:uncharacterized lipoprotein YmbA